MILAWACPFNISVVLIDFSCDAAEYVSQVTVYSSTPYNEFTIEIKYTPVLIGKLVLVKSLPTKVSRPYMSN